jgi:hypothetical protein
MPSHLTFAQLGAPPKPSASPTQQQSPPTSTARDASPHPEWHPPDVPIEADLPDRHTGNAEGGQIRPLSAGLASDEDGKEVGLNRSIDFPLLFRAWLFAVILVDAVDNSQMIEAMEKAPAVRDRWQRTVPFL